MMDNFDSAGKKVKKKKKETNKALFLKIRHISHTRLHNSPAKAAMKGATA